MLFLVLLPLTLAYDPAHAALQRVLDRHLRAGRVDYAALHGDPAELDAYVRGVADAPLAGMAQAERTALFIDAYNAFTLQIVAAQWPVASIRDLDGGRVWQVRRLIVGGQSYTLDDIEHRVLRPLGDPRVHAALNCASRGCAPLAAEVFRSAALDAQLDAAARRWVASSTLANGVLTVSRIFNWYGDDFVARYGRASADLPGLDGKAEAAANFVATYAPALAPALRAAPVRVAYAEYDWAVNAP